MELAVKSMPFGKKKTSGQMTDPDQWRKFDPQSCQACTSHDFAHAL
jgi:hypothetical protein